MKDFRRIIVALDNTEFDQKLLKYFSHFCDLSNPGKIYFTYVDSNLELTFDFDIVYKDDKGLPIPKDELISKIIHETLRESFGTRHGSKVSVNILEGSPLKAILHWEKVKNADLIVVGNKKSSNGSGVEAKIIARNTKASMLFVPETSRKNIRKILIPIDFSENSKVAMKNALEIAKKLHDPEIICFNMFNTPLASYPTINMNYEKFIKSIASFKKEAFDKYIDKFDTKGLDIRTDYVENTHNNVATHINEYANQNNFDLIMMSAQGHSLLERTIMGSVTEKLLSLDKEVPVMIFR